MIGRMVVLVAVVALAAGALAGPVAAGGFGFDLPVLTWPEGGMLSTKGARP